MSKQGGPRVASIHTHFNIFRNINDAQTGDVTVSEQIKAMERFVRWHERQVKVGTELLAQLRALEPAVVITDLSEIVAHSEPLL